MCLWLAVRSLVSWRMRIWRCSNVDCATVTWTEQALTAAPRSPLTQRVAKQYATRRVGDEGESVAALARALGTGWRTIMRAMVEVGTPMSCWAATNGMCGSCRAGGWRPSAPHLRLDCIGTLPKHTLA
jgi:hypothetical protein